MSDEVLFESRGCTQIKTIRFRYTWTINNFSFYVNTMGGKIVSPIFSNEANSSELTWHLEINPNGWYKDDKNLSYMCIYLHLASCNVSDFETNFKFSILNTKSEEVYKFVDNKLFGLGKFHGINSFIGKENLLNKKGKLFPYDHLTILCDITVLADTLNISEIFRPLPTKHYIANDFEFLFQNLSYLSDVTLVLEEKEFPAHKAILAARSAVFKDLFENDKKETEKDRFEIKDINHEVFSEMLQYIYTDKASNLEKLASKLLSAAEKYRLDGLKVMCVNAMCKNLSVGNAAEFYELGDRYHQIELSSQAKYYICVHALEITKTLGWKLMTETHPRLVTKLFRALAISHVKTQQNRNQVFKFKAEILSKTLRDNINAVKLSSSNSSIKPVFTFQSKSSSISKEQPEMVNTITKNSIFSFVKLENLPRTSNDSSGVVKSDVSNISPRSLSLENCKFVKEELTSMPSSFNKHQSVVEPALGISQQKEITKISEQEMNKNLSVNFQNFKLQSMVANEEISSLSSTLPKHQDAVELSTDISTRNFDLDRNVQAVTALPGVDRVYDSKLSK